MDGYGTDRRNAKNERKDGAVEYIMGKNIAIIPARSGSKGLKDKNIKELQGVPLIGYAIKAAKESGLYDRIVLSTDSEKYAEIGEKYGASIPFLRSKEMSSDSAGSWDVVKEVINHLKEQNEIYDTVTLLQPTSPLRTAKDICNAMQLFKEKNALSVISVCEVEHSPLWSNTLPEDGNMYGFEKKEVQNLPRQKLPVYYRMNGAIYIMKIENLDKIDVICDNECYAYVMDKNRSVDIDDELDFCIAEAILNRLA